MVDTTILENFLNEKCAKTGDIVEIIGEGEIKDTQTKYGLKPLLNVPVKLNGKAITWTPTRKAREQMNKLCNSSDTKAWVGKKFSVIIIDNKVMVGSIIA